jgi:uncharacterized protein (TIGR02001 family)
MIRAKHEQETGKMKFRPLIPGMLALALPSFAAAQAMPEFSFGANLTSNYVYRGTSQTDDKPAIQGYVEGAIGTFYGGLWASTVDLDDDNVEFDLYLGIRPTFGDLEVDLNYTRFLYDDSGDCCGEVALLLSYPIGEVASVGGGAYADFENDIEWFEVTAAYTAPQGFTVGGTVGTDFGSLEEGDDDKVAWDVGVSYSFTEIATADLRFHDSNYDPGRLVVSIGIDF